MFVDTWPNYNTTGLICWYIFWLAPAKIESVLEDRAVQATARVFQTISGRHAERHQAPSLSQWQTGSLGVRLGP
jgi:hypothetical protein